MNHAFLDDMPAPQGDILTRIAVKIKELSDLERVIEGVEDNLKNLSEKRRILKTSDLPDLLTEAGVQSVSLEDGTIVSKDVLASASIPKGNEGPCYEYLKANGLDFLIKNTVSVDFDAGEDEKAEELIKSLSETGLDYNHKPTVHAQSLKKQVRDLYEQGVIFPECFKPFYGFEAKIKRPKGL